MKGRAAGGTGWAVAWRGATEVDAALVAGQLRAAGLDVLVDGSQTPYRAMTFPLGGTWVVRVPGRQLEDARAVLREVGEEGNLDGEEEEGLLSRDQRATLVVAGAGLGLLGVVLIIIVIVEAAG